MKTAGDRTALAAAMFMFGVVPLACGDQSTPTSADAPSIPECDAYLAALAACAPSPGPLLADAHDGQTLQLKRAFASRAVDHAFRVMAIGAKRRLLGP